MSTPKSPPAPTSPPAEEEQEEESKPKPNTNPSSPSPPPPTDPNEPIPLHDPRRTHPKRLLPGLSAVTPHGHISGHPRPAALQLAFDARRATIFRTMTAEEIERAYEDVAAQVRQAMEEAERGGKEAQERIEKLVQQREMERRVWGKLKGAMGGG